MAVTGRRARVVIGTAGHVDHGKTTLVRVLTGHDTDRLPEEKARGISIELGFAPFDLPSGRAAVVDVPGHERFIHHMVAGASGIDAVLLVVAADEGVMPQTREHLDILTLLGVQRGVVAVTKTDAVDPAWLELVLEEVRQELAGTFLAQAPVVPVSAVTGEGLADLVAHLDRLVASTPPRSAAGPMRLPVDRVFTVPGFGTVVTGTLASGAVRPEDRLVLYPEGRPVRVRSVEVHGERVEEARAGERVALNLAGVERSEVRRGQVVAAPGAVQVTDVFAAHLRVVPAARALKHNARVHLHVGTTQVAARAILLEGDEIAPGGEGLARMRAEGTLALSPGDRFVIRSPSPPITLGGGSVLEVSGRHRRLHAADLADLRQRVAARPIDRLRAIVNQRPGRAWSPVDLARALGLSESQVAELLAQLGPEEAPVFEGQVLGRAVLEEWRARVEKVLGEVLAAEPLRLYVGREELRQRALPQVEGRLFALLLSSWAQAGAIDVQGDRVTLPGREPQLSARERQLADRIEEVLAEAPFSPPTGAALAEALGVADLAEIEPLFLYLADRGRIRRLGEIWFHTSALQEVKRRVQAYFEAKERLTLADFRALAGTSRKYAVPLLEWLDAEHVTRRVGDERLVGRR